MRTAARDDADHPASLPAPEPRWAALQLLREPDYRAYWLATVPWNLSRWMETVVAGWLMLELTNSPWQVALLGFCRSAALPVIGPFAGVVADRVDRLHLIRLAQAVNLAVPALVTLLLLTGSLAAWHLFLASLLLGLSWAVEWPARRALMVDIVGTRALVQATVFDNVSMNTSKIVGPALAGVLLKFLGATPSYAVLTLCSLAALGLFLLVRRPAQEQGRVAGSPLRNLIDGLVYVTRHRTILAVLLITIIMNCLVFPYMQLLPVMARDILRVGPVELGWLAAADGIGALIGLPLIARTRRGGPHGWIFILGSLLMATTLLAFALAPWYGLALLLLIVGGIGHAGFGTMQGTILLSQSSPVMRGRVLGALTLAIGASPFGALLMGLLAERWDASVSIALCAATACVTVLLVGALAPSLRRVDQRG